jgi:hypothetical protein
MTKEVLEALCKGVQDDLANKLHVEEVAIKHRIEHIIKTLTELKRDDIPYSVQDRLWHDLSLSVTNLFECKGKINAYGYAKNLSSVLSAKEKEENK